MFARFLVVGDFCSYKENTKMNLQFFIQTIVISSQRYSTSIWIAQFINKVTKAFHIFHPTSKWLSYFILLYK